MMNDWQRKRHPEDVPTPVAVALADFCRRARGPASALAVRDALSRLDADDDADVEALADAEPVASPLGPFAAVDIVRGTSPEVAAERERSGYYLALKHAAGPGAAVPMLTAAAPEATKEKAPAAKTKRPARAKKTTVAQKIAPRKREKGEPAKSRAKVPALPPASSYLPKRNLPEPRGRYANVHPTKSSLDVLFKAGARDALEAVVEVAPHRFALHKTLEAAYVGQSGRELSGDDVEYLLDRSKLRHKMEQKEADSILTALAASKGAQTNAAKLMDLPPSVLDDLIGRLRLRSKVARVREEFVREALSPENLAARLELVRRSKYLEDLDCRPRFESTLKAELEGLLANARAAAPGDLDLVAAVARSTGLPLAPLRLAVERLELTLSP